MYTCPMCGRKFETISALRSHFLMSHMNGNVCPCCGKKFRHLYNHIARADYDLCHVVIRYILKPKHSGEEKALVEAILKSGLTLDKIKNIVDDLFSVKPRRGNGSNDDNEYKPRVMTYRTLYLGGIVQLITTLSNGIRSALHRCAVCELLKQYLGLDKYPYIDCYKDCSFVKVEFEKNKDVLIKYIMRTGNVNNDDVSI